MGPFLNDITKEKDVNPESKTNGSPLLKPNHLRE